MRRFGIYATLSCAAVIAMSGATAGQALAVTRTAPEPPLINIQFDNTKGGTQIGGKNNTQGGTQGAGAGNVQGGTQGAGSGNTQGGTQGGTNNVQGGTQGATNPLGTRAAVEPLTGVLSLLHLPGLLSGGLLQQGT
ncbi:hypothetical protein OIB37_23125 [Streptomyces sp. NBC_00820]|uniref:hypothetical protein n=1 Tax=Streptomyces sp. NBC_00820 TaxID=2975842 RepID=UPI002ED273B2|nr:hypothetical protein OIB37_23125 [Streptomyces sp. NBC_00820]